jgi:hypothetical protein
VKNTIKILEAESPTRIAHEKGDEEAWICVCGNTPGDHGFYPCDSDGNEMEPVIGSDWENLYVCAQCGRSIDMDTLEIKGQNLNPRFLY